MNPFIDDITRTLFEFLIAVELIEKPSGGQSRRYKLILRLATSHEGYENSDRKEGRNGREAAPRFRSLTELRIAPMPYMPLCVCIAFIDTWIHWRRRDHFDDGHNGSTFAYNF